MTYEQIWSVKESGRGAISFRFLVSDTYKGLFEGDTYDDRVTVDFIDIETTKQDLDLDEGKQAAHELAFSIDYYACLTDEDFDCLNFILAAQQDADVDTNGDGTIDVAKQERWVLLQISEDGGSTWLTDFRGKVQPKMSADDLKWHGGEFVSTPNPDRIWKCTALQFEVAALDVLLKDVLDCWKSGNLPSGGSLVGFTTLEDWKGVNVYPRTCFPTVFSDAGSVEDYQWARFWGLCSLDDFIVNLLNVAGQYIKDTSDVGSSFAIDIDAVTMPFECAPATIKPYAMHGDRGHVVYPFYAELSESALRKQPVLFGASPSNAFKFSWSMVEPPITGGASLSFLKSKTVVGLLADIAQSFGLFLTLEYASDTVTVKFKPRGDISTGDIFIPDVNDGKLDTEPIFIEADKTVFGGKKNNNALDGRDTYKASGGYIHLPKTLIQSELTKTAPEKLLLLTTGYTTIDYSEIDVEIFFLLYDIAGGVLSRSGKGLLNLFIENHVGDGEINDPFYSTLDTGLYLDYVVPHQWEVVGYFDGYNGQLTLQEDTGSSPFGATLPIDKIIGRVGRDYTGQVWKSLSEYVNSIRELDGRYYESEYQLTVPYLTRFRTTESGADSVANLTLGSELTLDGVLWVVVGIERNYADLTTKLRLHNKERFALSTYSDGGGEYPFPSISGDPFSAPDAPVPESSTRSGATVQYADYIYITDVADLTTPGDADGEELAEGDVVLLANQTVLSENGLYKTDADGELVLIPIQYFLGQIIVIRKGEQWKDKAFIVSDITVVDAETTEITFDALGTQATYNDDGYKTGRVKHLAGAGMTITPTTLNKFTRQLEYVNAGILSINGSVGAHTIQHAETGGLSVSTSGSTTTIQNTGVTSLNGKNYAVTISSTGSGIDVTSLSSTTIGITNTGVIAVNGITNTASVTIAAGTGIGVSTSGSTVTISNPGILTLNSLAGAVSIAGESGGIGLSISGTTISLTNLGIKKISATGGDVAGNVTFEGVGGVTVERISATLLRFGISLADVGSVHVWDTVTDDEWTKPAGAKLTFALVIGGGGGGSSGECKAAGTIRKGGGAGSAGARVFRIFPSSALGATADVVIGLGGAGGAGITTGNNNAGTVGGTTIFNDGGAVPLIASGGNCGTGGGYPITGGAGLMCFYEYVYVQAPDAGDPSDGTANAANPADSYYLSAPGGGGGSIAADGTRYHGGKGGKVNHTLGSGSFLIEGGDYGVSEGEAGDNGTTGTIGHAYQVSSGGGGGASGDDAGTVDGGDGGDAADYGGGGGGGGAATTGATSGAGGQGADGYCLVITICG